MNFDHDEVLSCPYNKTHRIPSSRFQRHLVNCEKNYPPDYKVICPYNATHRLSKSEIQEHINTCPMRRTVEGSYIQPSRTRKMRPGQSDSSSEIDCNGY
ncbi:PREDICTED: gametocyte-specific factor 1-like [Wasmannia auropunctata]|uniref:gametocyte-specific factor 1-like n=1 Tax=Wasmannia auropunctata TaxID=64793 RepID=UPI0005ED6B9C|nr:PREDICTED: gametocyte-specific factor 1-like [Wasmannia auropunctata]XP_011694351.1 PREDICTED: gametocyte-specific factor 1-like [Wasmannia auropunctata]XP_011694361.1 PREDICTED: gametocyte-specific factor 1-like [Wasmannia auropunctata]XP_011694370.1 PREDICTED: gametocyte-specific factor 1-like [Wasmannia auropunctata]XP_011694379.1 PREDICTED: gametocyte-specific factor 1-like [Wasmannia auropunctata]